MNPVECVHCRKATMQTKGWCNECMGMVCTRETCKRCAKVERKMRELTNKIIRNNQYDKFSAK